MLFGAVLSQAADQTEWINLNDGELIVRSRTFWHDQTTDSLKFRATGDLAQIIDGPEGAILQAGAVSGEVLKLPDGTYLLNTAEALGRASLTVDTTKAIPPPGPNSDIDRSTIESDRMNLSSTGLTQTFTVPGALKITDEHESKGTAGPKPSNPFEQTSAMTGSSATITYTVGTKEASKGAEAGRTARIDFPRSLYDLQTGTLEGPVHYHSVRTEHPPDSAAPRVTEYDLTADRLLLDFTGATGKITALGHVVWRESGDFPISGKEDREEITVDKEGRILSFKGTGGPPTTVLPLPAPGGGHL